MTTLAPDYEARARKMVLDKSCWAGSALCMKRIVKPMEFGVIFEAAPDRIVIVNHPTDPPREAIVFGSIDELVAACWTVD